MKKNKTDVLRDGIGRVYDSILERYDRIDADIAAGKIPPADKQRRIYIPILAASLAFILILTPFALNFFNNIISPIGPGVTTPEQTTASPETPTPDTSGTDESTAAPSPDESTPSESTPSESTPSESTPSESTPAESTPNDGPGYDYSKFEFELNDDGESYTIVSYIGRDETVTVPPTYEGKPITVIGNMVFYSKKYIKSITLPETIVSIGDSAFHKCEGIESIVLPDSVNHIAGEAFAFCKSLKEINIPDGIEEIGESVFAYSGLESIVLPESVTSIGFHAFMGCSKLESISMGSKVSSIGDAAFSLCSFTEFVIPDGVTTIASTAFSGCEKLSAVTIPNSVTTIGSNAFLGCDSLESIEIPDSVTEIGSGAFESCKSLKSLDISDRVGSIGHFAFAYCTSLESIKLPRKLTIISMFTFEGCTSLKDVSIGENVTRIESDAFNGCTALTEITLPNRLYIIDGGAFRDCSSLRRVDIPESMVLIYGKAFANCSSLAEIRFAGTREQWNNMERKEGWDENAGDYTVYASDDGTLGNPNYSDEYTEGLGFSLNGDGETYSVIGISYSEDDSREVIIPKIYKGCYVTAIAENAFKEMSFYSVTIPDSVTSIGDSAFYGCYFFDISIPDSVTSIGVNAFSGIYSLVPLKHNGVLYLGNPSNPYAAVVGYDTKTNLTQCDVHPDAKVIAADAFKSAKFEKITIGDKVVSICKRAFYECSKLVDIELGSGLTYIGAGAFYGCSSLEEIVIPDGIASIEASTFDSCWRLWSVTLPDSVRSIGSSAFSKCYALKRISLPENLEKIGELAFMNCWSLESMILPESLREIDGRVLELCSALEIIRYKGTAEQWDAITKVSGWDDGARNYILYTEWDESALSFTVEYILNGGEGDRRNPTTVYEHDHIKSLYIPKKAGAEFVGWTWEGQDTPIKYPEIRDISSPIVLTACWTFGEGEHAQIHEIEHFTPTVDGELDYAYYFGSEPLKFKDVGPEFTTSEIYFLWNGEALYFYMNIRDETPSEDYGFDCEYLDIVLSISDFDATAGYIEANRADDIGDAHFRIYKNGGTTLVENGLEYSDGSHGGFGKWVFENTDTSDPQSGSNYVVYVPNYEDGFVVEGFIKWSDELKASVIRDELIIGIGVQYADDIDADGQIDKMCRLDNAGSYDMSMTDNRAACGKFRLEDGAK